VKILLKVWGRWAKVRLHLLQHAAAQTQSGLSYFFKKLNYHDLTRIPFLKGTVTKIYGRMRNSGKPQHMEACRLQYLFIVG